MQAGNSRINYLSHISWRILSFGTRLHIMRNNTKMNGNEGSI